MLEGEERRRAQEAAAKKAPDEAVKRKQKEEATKRPAIEKEAKDAEAEEDPEATAATKRAEAAERRRAEAEKRAQEERQQAPTRIPPEIPPFKLPPDVTPIERASFAHIFKCTPKILTACTHYGRGTILSLTGGILTPPQTIASNGGGSETHGRTKEQTEAQHGASTERNDTNKAPGTTAAENPEETGDAPELASVPEHNNQEPPTSTRALSQACSSAFAGVQLNMVICENAKRILMANGYPWDPKQNYNDPRQWTVIANWIQKHFAEWAEWMEKEPTEGVRAGPIWDPTLVTEDEKRLRRMVQPFQPLPPPFPKSTKPMHENAPGWSDEIVDEGGPIPNSQPRATALIIDQRRIHPNAVKPIAGTTFAPPYNSNFLRRRPELADALHHVNCSYLTAQTRPRNAGGSARTYEGYGVNYDAPTLGELKQHVQSLMALIKEIGISTSHAEVDAEARYQQIMSDPTVNGAFRAAAPRSFVSDTGVFDFIQNLSKPYKPVNKSDKMPLSFLLNTVSYRDNKSAAWDNVCPLIRLPAEDVAKGQHPMPFTRVDALMEHADAALLMIDDAMSASGGLLSVLPMNLPVDDPRRKTFLGQMIHFMRVMVSKVAALDKAYGSALDTLAGEAVVPRHLKLHHFRPEEMRAAFAEDQQNFILTNVQDASHKQIWYEMQKKGAEQAEANGTGLYDVYIPTRYRGLVGGKTIFITPDPARMGEGMPGEEHNKSRPMVIAVPRPGRPTDMTEWMKKHAGELDEARAWKDRALKAEKLVKKLKRDVEYLTPEVELEEAPGVVKSMTATQAWARVTAKEDSVRMALLDRGVYAKHNRELEHRNKLLEGENARLQNWKDRHILNSKDINKKLLSDNELLADKLKEAMLDWKVAKDERDVYRETIKTQNDDKMFELEQLRRTHNARVKMLENQVIIEAQRHSKGAQAVNRELAVENGRLQEDVRNLLHQSEIRNEYMAGLEKRFEEAQVDCRSLERWQDKYAVLEQRLHDMQIDVMNHSSLPGHSEVTSYKMLEKALKAAKKDLGEKDKEIIRKNNALQGWKNSVDNWKARWESFAREKGDFSMESTLRELRDYYNAEIQNQMTFNEELQREIKELKDAAIIAKNVCNNEKRTLEDRVNRETAARDQAVAEVTKANADRDILERNIKKYEEYAAKHNGEIQEMQKKVEHQMRQSISEIKAKYRSILQDYQKGAGQTSYLADEYQFLLRWFEHTLCFAIEHGDAHGFFLDADGKNCKEDWLQHGPDTALDNADISDHDMKSKFWETINAFEQTLSSVREGVLQSTDHYVNDKRGVRRGEVIEEEEDEVDKDALGDGEEEW